MHKYFKLFITVALIVAAFAVGSWYSGRPGSTQAAVSGTQRFYCPMHPEYTSDRPGIAPCCGMRLEPIPPGGISRAAGMPRGTVEISPDKLQLMGVRLAKVEHRSAEHVLRVSGRVAADESRTYVVNAAVDGWIREVHEPTTGSRVANHQPLATFYSKEFLAAQQNYFYALNSLDRMNRGTGVSAEQVSLTRVQVWSNEDILESLGMTQQQIQEVGQSRQFARSVVIRSPADGFVLARRVSAGQRFQRGEELYRIASLDRVWVLADLFEPDARHLQPGQTARVMYLGRAHTARAADVLPIFDPATRTLKARLELDNAALELRPDMLVDVEIPVKLAPAPMIPAQAILQSGSRATVFVARGQGLFEPRAVDLGGRYGEQVEVRSGLMPGDTIVVSGTFLLDSESRMRMAAQGKPQGKPEEPSLQYLGTDPICGMEVTEATHTSQYKGKTYYFCAASCKREFEANPEKYVAGSREHRH